MLSPRVPFFVAAAQRVQILVRPQILDHACIVEDTTTHALTTFAGVYLWNQDATTTNLTPAWDEFKIPMIPPPK